MRLDARQSILTDDDSIYAVHSNSQIFAIPSAILNKMNIPTPDSEIGKAEYRQIVVSRPMLTDIVRVV